MDYPSDDPEEFDRRRIDYDTLWGALRLERLRIAIGSRPQGIMCVKELRFSTWLGDIEGGGDVVAAVWPSLRSCTIELGAVRGQGNRLGSSMMEVAMDRCFNGLTKTQRLLHLEVRLSGDIEAIEPLLRLAPNLRFLLVNLNMWQIQGQISTLLSASHIHSASELAQRSSIIMLGIRPSQFEYPGSSAGLRT
jgi:hypothetical protein